MRAIEFVESYFDAWNHRDPKEIADHLCDNGLYRDVPENAQRTPEELIESLAGFFAESKHRYELIGEIASSANMLAFQYRITPDTGAETGSSTDSWRGAEFITLSGDHALKIVDYYDIPEQAQIHKYSKSGLCPERLSAYRARLESVMNEQHAFLRPDLTLPTLADEIHCSVNHLSQVINSSFDTSFFGYLNHHRVEYAKQLLNQPDNQADAILNIAFSAGFNSNSAFYVAFKKHVGQTPAQFRQTCQSDNDD